MKKRMFFYMTLIISAGLLCFFAASVYITNSNNLNIAKDTVMEATRIFAGLYGSSEAMGSHGGGEAAGPYGGGEAAGAAEVIGNIEVTDIRLTLIAPDGKVLADSRPFDISAAENHLNRPEIQAALSGAPEAYIRYSETLGVDYIYYALKVDIGGDGIGGDGISGDNISGDSIGNGETVSNDIGGDGYVFVRAALPVAKIDAYLNQSLPLLIVLMVAVALLCFALSRVMIARFITPFEKIGTRLRHLTSGEYAPGPVAGSYDEIDVIIRGIDEVAQVMQDSFADLREEKNKLDYIMSNIGDGLFVLDDEENITYINAAALNVFSVNLEIVGKNLNYITNDTTLVETVRGCVNHDGEALFEIDINGRIFLTAARRLPNTHFTMVVLSDITESRDNAKRREEFFANASHELKTPLTAIKGFGELAAINNKDENIGKYIECIGRETSRMLTLIDDMLKLSELENAHKPNPVPVSLAQVAGEACETLSAAISEKQISATIVGDGIVEAAPGHAYELVKNIIENAVRYNNQGGRVDVTIEEGTKSTRLVVADDGIGIPPAEQTRIFERFYRVEKSRSQRGGGTGLGLSIVKHICALYGWKLSLKSKLGVGTEITVAFDDE
ncbi:MAG: ATP-binding protein [Oscillospiraceae bacterium]|nr:ATP-binding protein [Oscillospiraceae bacterium]